MDQPQILQRKEGLVYTFSIPMESSNQRQYQQGLHRSNYKAEGEAIIHAAHTIKYKVDNNTQIVFLTDALSVLQALMNDNLPQLEQALYTTKPLRTVLQWIPSYCGVHGNEQADGLA